MANLAERLFKFYPPQEAGNPEVVLAGCVELFEQYPEDIVLKAVSVTHGIPRKFKFMPRLAEIADFLEELMAPIYRQAARPSPALPEPPIDRTKRKTYAELVELCAKDGLLIGPKSKKFTGEQVTEFRKKFGISDEQWNTIPDAPTSQN